MNGIFKCIDGTMSKAPFSQKGVAIDRVEAAITTLTGMDYTFNGGTHWKPPLGVKPVFTQAMADAGGLPPVGMKCLHTGLINDYENPFNIKDGVEVEILMSYGGGVIFRCAKHNDNGLVVDFTQNSRHFKPLPTERDVIIDDIENIIASQGFLNKDNITYQMANLIYDAGYRKSDK
jgi:hypothetical protein